MKSVILLLSTTFILTACSPDPQTQSSDTPIASSEWVKYEGGSGPGKGKNIVLISGDEEYRSEEALPLLGKILASQHGFNCTVLFAQDTAKPGIVDPNYLHNIPGLEALKTADLMVIFTRFRELPDEQMQMIDDYLKSGKPVIGIRTATHAFNIKDSTSKWLHYGNYYEGEKAEWHGGFGRLVLGEKWISHHGHHKHQSTRGIVAAKDHPVMRGIADGDIWAATDVYGVRLPLPGDSEPLVLGQVINRAGEYNESDPFFGLRPSDSEVATENPANKEAGNPNDPMMPVAWVKSYQLPGGQTGRAFATTVGAATDMTSEGVRRMFVNVAYWLTGLEVPEKASADIPGIFNPSPYSFQKDEYWDGKNIVVRELGE
ncbi:MAG: ThuA domain-containing protein [Bacteroidia bacterium]|nr:ThuA domain-containing protein [Bacteroidia bacterium]